MWIPFNVDWCWTTYSHRPENIGITLCGGPTQCDYWYFLKAFAQYVSSPLVGKKAANVVSHSESKNRSESSHLLLMDERDIIDCLLSHPCLSSRKKKEKETNEIQKVFWNGIGWEQILVVISFSWFHCQTVLSQSPWRFVWRQAFRSGEYQRHKTMMKNSRSLLLCTQSGTVTRLAMMLKTSCVILNQVIIQPTGKLHYLRTW